MAIFGSAVDDAISTHALTEGDDLDIYTYDEWFLFQLTPSRRATLNSQRTL